MSVHAEHWYDFAKQTQMGIKACTQSIKSVVCVWVKSIHTKTRVIDHFLFDIQYHDVWNLQFYHFSTVQLIESIMCVY